MIKRRHIATVVTTVGVLGKLGMASASEAETLNSAEPPAASLSRIEQEGAIPFNRSGNEPTLTLAAAARHGDDDGHDGHDGDNGDDGGDDGDSGRAKSPAKPSAKHHGNDSDDGDDGGDD